MRVKKIITLFTVAALTLGSLTGCGSSAGTDGKKSHASSKKVSHMEVQANRLWRLQTDFRRMW